MDVAFAPLSRLERQPELLAAAADRVQLEIEELAVTHFRSFIESSSCVQDLSRQLLSLDAKTRLVSASLPALAQSCETFLSHSAAWRQQRRLNQMMTEVCKLCACVLHLRVCL